MLQGPRVTMRWNPSRRHLTAVILLAVTLSACAGSGEGEWRVLHPEPYPDDREVLSIAGTVQYLTIEGGVFVIRTEDGAHYQPINLPEHLRRDGVPIEAEAVRRDDIATIGMAGTIVELLRIRERTGDRD